MRTCVLSGAIIPHWAVFRKGAGPTAVTSRSDHNLALAADYQVRAWGQNLHGQLGSRALMEEPYATPTPTATITPSATPTPVVTPTATPSAVQQIQLRQGWNWFSFALVPPASPAPDEPSPTAYFREYWGLATVNGAPAPAGTLVEAFSSRGDLVGRATVSQEGYFGYMRVYGQDPQEPTLAPEVPGMLPGEVIGFRLNGRAAALPSVSVLWQAGFEPARVDLAGSYGMDISRVLASLGGAHDYVLGETGTYSTDPGKRFLNTLADMEPGKGYMIRMDRPMTLVLGGDRLAASTPLALAAGWRWIGYLPEAARPLRDALGSLEGSYDYLLGATGTYVVGGLPFLNTLTSMEPGGGYVTRMTRGATPAYDP